MDGLRELEQVRLIMRADLPYIGVHPTPITFKHNFVSIGDYLHQEGDRF